jgi:predicted nucleic acid-binding OB-fold protein
MPPRSKKKIEQTTNNSLAESSCTIDMPSPDMEQSTMNVKELQHDDNQNPTNSEIHYTTSNTKTKNEERFSSFYPQQQPLSIPSSVQIHALQMELDVLRKELEILKLQKSQQQSNIQLVDRNLVTATPTHIVINTDPLQQMKDFVKPFYGNSNDDVVKWVESIVHYFDVARVTGNKEQLYFQYAPAFLEEYAYKWWSEKEQGISNWFTFKQMLIEQFDRKNEYLI